MSREAGYLFKATQFRTIDLIAGCQIPPPAGLGVGLFWCVVWGRHGPVRRDLIQGESHRRLWQMMIRLIIKHQTLSDEAKRGIHARTPSLEYGLWQGQGACVKELGVLGG
jgi:hypothetical protein